MAAEDVLIDQWSQLGHKAGMDPADTARTSDWKPYGWLGDRPDTIRRLNAYVRLAAYTTNQARHFLAATDTDTKRRHREYGDAELIVERVAAAVLGDEPSIAVAGADEPAPALPELPARPDAPNTGDPEIDALITGHLDTAWTDQARAAVDDWIRRRSNAPLLDARQAWLDQWATAELFWPKARQNESASVGLGDSVIVVGWDPTKTLPDATAPGRPTITVYEPDAYHPDLPDTPGDSYPTDVRLAWETLDDADVAWLNVVFYWLAPTSRPQEDYTPATAPTGTSKRYAYAPDTESRATCYRSAGKWKTADLGKKTIWDLPRDNPANPDTITLADGSVGPAAAVDLGIDFIPIIHTPNTLTGGHFGVSLLSRVLQILDDLASTDTDIRSAASLAGLPPVFLAGVTANDTAATINPGGMYWLGDNGRLDALDTSASVEALRHILEDLLERLGTNSQIPAGLLGRIDASEVPSGLALALTFTPFVQLVGHLRLIRDHKYRLLLKMVQRMAIAGGTLTAPVYDAGVAFGSFMPNDIALMVEIVTKLRAGKIISPETALRFLAEIGLDVGDLTDELAAIRAADPEGARLIADATDSVALAAEWLGVELPEPVEETQPPGSIDTNPARPEITLNN